MLGQHLTMLKFMELAIYPMKPVRVLLLYLPTLPVQQVAQQEHILKKTSPVVTMKTNLRFGINSQQHKTK